MEYLHKDRNLFKESIDLTVYQMGLNAEVVEKDYYVTMILRELSEKLPFIVFKGGTSLSKCYRVIKRFSEDIDVTIDMSLSQGQKKKVKAAILEITEIMGMKILNIEETRSWRDYNRYIIGYETVLPNAGEMIQQTVQVETSYTTVSFPTVILQVSNYIGNMMETEAADLMENYGLQPFEMKVQRIDRTLADKVFAICDYYLKNEIKKHSRHIYDIYKLLPLVSIDAAFSNLVKEVRTVRKTSPICLSAQEDVDITKILNAIISEVAYKDDYEKLTIKLLEEKVDYETAIIALEKIVESRMFER